MHGTSSGLSGRSTEQGFAHGELTGIRPLPHGSSGFRHRWRPAGRYQGAILIARSISAPVRATTTGQSSTMEPGSWCRSNRITKMSKLTSPQTRELK